MRSTVLDDLTDDALLGGRLRFQQPARGYRVAIDPVLLAAAVPASSGARVLDVGAGTGAASLCLAARAPECQIVGLELQRELCRIASHNVTQNGLEPQVQMVAGDLGRPPPRLTGASFDHVMTNPPHLAARAATAAPNRERALAHVEGNIDLANWFAGCVRMLKPGGMLTLIHRAERSAEILAALSGKVGDLILFPLWTGAESRPAKRLIIQARKGTQGPLRLMRGLILHERDGEYTRAAEAILRHGKGLDLVPARGGDDG